LILLSCYSCKTENNLKEKEEKKAYPRVVGDILYDPEIDADFIQCDSFSNQYYGVAGGLIYQGELAAIKEDLFNTYKSIKKKGQTGFLTVRFKVNCKGASGMFRTYSTDMALKEFEFDDNITSQFLEATKALDNWEIATYNGSAYDYYQYLTFKLIDSELKEITP